MRKLSLFENPHLLGFEDFFDRLERVTKTSEGYPPYNIEKIPPHKLRITLAVAGFSMDDLSVTQEDNQLVIRGQNKEDDQERIFIHHGIASRQFVRNFVLADNIEITGAFMKNGLLHVDLERPISSKNVKHIQISSNETEKQPTNIKAICFDDDKI